MRFLNAFRGEMYRIFHTSTFLLVLTALIVLVVADGCVAYKEYRQNLTNVVETIPRNEDGTFQEHPFLQNYTLYNSWIGGHPNSVLGFVFFYTMPIYTGIAYSWTYLSEKRSGYTRLLAARIGRLPYFFCKHLAVFLAGSLVVLIPLLTSFLFTASLIPAYKPNVDMALYYQIGSGSLMRDLYYAHPLAAVLCNLTAITLFAGLWSTVPLTVSYFVSNRFIALFAPYFVLLFFIATADHALVYRSFLETSLFDYLQLTSTTMIQSLGIFLGEMGILLMFPLLTTWRMGAYTDVL